MRPIDLLHDREPTRFEQLRQARNEAREVAGKLERAHEHLETTRGQADNYYTLAEAVENGEVTLELTDSSTKLTPDQLLAYATQSETAAAEWQAEITRLEALGYNSPGWYEEELLIEREREAGL